MDQLYFHLCRQIYFIQYILMSSHLHLPYFHHHIIVQKVSHLRIFIHMLVIKDRGSIHHYKHKSYLSGLI